MIKTPIYLDKVALQTKSYKILTQILEENPHLKTILSQSDSVKTARQKIKHWIEKRLHSKPKVRDLFQKEHITREEFETLDWEDYAAFRILDYIKHSGERFNDPNLNNEQILSNPIKLLYCAYKYDKGGATPEFFEDMLMLFRQLNGTLKKPHVSRNQLNRWMERYPSGLDPRIVKLHAANREHILKLIIKKIDRGEFRSTRFKFKVDMTADEKLTLAQEWWQDFRFHLSFAIRSPKVLNEMLDYSLSPETMEILERAEEKGMPFFINPYYLSLLLTDMPEFAIGADQAIRDYIIYNRDLIEEFGEIVAWEMEDLVEPGKPNAAGWILPSHTAIHRRYPDVAILIPETMGRGCGGFCSTCQRMYDYQRGNLNFKYEKLRPEKSWSERLQEFMEYFEKDAQLRDILITGGDALMSSDKSLGDILDAIYNMARNKIKANKERHADSKYAEILRVRLGTRLPIYLPQRINHNLIQILSEFKAKAEQIGIKQFVIQTHYESPLEITPESKAAIRRLLSAGWMVTNQLVFTTAASRRGHTAKLRQAMNDIGVLPYYTFTCKGFRENYHHFATNSRAMQEQIEEKAAGKIAPKYYEQLKTLRQDPTKVRDNIKALRREAKLPFLATDRNVLNLPAVGKSLSYRVIGITRNGRRILEFDHDPTRPHSPIVEKMGKVIIIESKSIPGYLRQLDEMGEDIAEYISVYGYSLGATEKRMPIYEYPDYEYQVTSELTNFQMTTADSFPNNNHSANSASKS